MLSSCLGESEPEGQIAGYFSIQHTSSGYVLHMDAGQNTAIVYPSPASVSALTGGKGFEDVKRASLSMKYKDANYSIDEKKNLVVLDAELLAGQNIPVRNLLTESEATDKKILEKDSIGSIESLDRLWGYRGYITAVYTSMYIAKASMGIVPTMNVVATQDTSDPSIYNCQFVLNPHKKNSTDMSGGRYQFATSFDITSLVAYIPAGADSITFKFKGEGISKPVSIKLGRRDFGYAF